MTDDKDRDEGESFYQTKGVRVLWIPPRKATGAWARALVSLDVLAVAVVVALLIRVSFVSPVARAEAAQRDTSGEMADIAATAELAAPPAVVRDSSPPAPVVVAYTIPTDRAAIASEIARCKNPAARCSVDHVLRLARGLIEQRNTGAPAGATTR